MIELNNYIDTISYIIQKHKDITEEWDSYCASNGIEPFNQKKMQVIDLVESDELFDNVKKYLSFLIQNTIDVSEHLEDNNIRYRLKTLNSVESKIFKYVYNNVEKGRVPVLKCLNDIYGTRIITNKYYTYEEIQEFIDKHFPGLKCIPSIKNGYNATHLYFKIDNYHFQWEMQIWSKKYENSNIASHTKHKQAYAEWEDENNKRRY